MSKYETWDEWKRAVGFTPSAPEPERTGVSSIDQEIAGLANSLDALYAELDDLDNERAVVEREIDIAESRIETLRDRAVKQLGHPLPYAYVTLIFLPSKESPPDAAGNDGL